MNERKCRFKQLNNRGWLYQKYHIEGLVQREIAEIIGCGIVAVGRALKYFNISTPNRNSRKYQGYNPGHYYRTKEINDKNAEAHLHPALKNRAVLFQLHDIERLSQTEIANKLGVSQAAVNRALKRLGISARTQSEAQKGLLAGAKNPMFGKHHSAEHKKRLSENERMEGNPNWKGGISFEPYCHIFNDNLKERVREFFDRKCYVCNKREGKNNRKLDVHHVNYDKMVCCNNTPPLFVPLCQCCHGKTHHNQKDWQEFFEVSLQYLTQGKCFYTQEEMAICDKIPIIER